MTRTTFLIIWVGIAVLLFALMFIAWRARVRRDSALAQPQANLVGDLLATFAHVAYVATTPIEKPLNRAAIPGLAFRGWSELSVRRDGVVIEVTGENPVEIPLAQIIGTDTASSHMNRAVERDGLTMLRWRSTGDAETALESSFRFDSPNEQRAFAEAITGILPDTDTTTGCNTATTTSQENA